MGRVVAGLLSFAARRWPGGGGDEMTREWRAELAVLPSRRGRLAFAGSLAAASIGGFSLLGAISGVGVVALLAGAGFNGVHVVGHEVGGVAATGAVVVAAAGMAWLGRRWAGGSPGWMVLGLGVAVGAFLLAGNRVAVMPYMGWVDVAPGVAAWTLVSLGGAAGAVRLVAGGRGRAGIVVAGVGGVVALDAAAGFGSAHAAGELGVPLVSAPLWLPLSLLPGGTVRFGAFHADGAGRFGGRLVTGPAFHGSDVLLGNVSAMVGPLLLCTAFAMSAVMAVRVRAAMPEPATAVDGRRAALAAVAVVAILLAPPATGVRGAEMAALVWLIAGAACIAAATGSGAGQARAGIASAGVRARAGSVGARRMPGGAGFAAAVVFGPAVCALVGPDVVRPLPVRALLAVVALGFARMDLWMIRAGIRGLGVDSRPGRGAGWIGRVWVTLALVGPWLALAGGAVLVAMSVDTGARRAGAVAESVARIEHNTAEFGFGFVGTPGGMALVIALVGVAVGRWRVGVATHGG